MIKSNCTDRGEWSGDCPVPGISGVLRVPVKVALVAYSETFDLWIGFIPSLSRERGELNEVICWRRRGTKVLSLWPAHQQSHMLLGKLWRGVRMAMARDALLP